MAGKAELVEHVSNSVDDLTKRQAGEAVDAVFEAITRQVQGGDRCTIPGFGSFQVTERAARKGRNPSTGETIDIPASKSVRFKAGKDLKESVNR